MDQITVIVVDDHPLFLQGVIDAISLSPDLVVVGQASNGDAALKAIRQLRPTVAVVDVNLPVINGQQVVRQAVMEKLPTRVVLLTAYDDPEQMVHSMRGGAAGYCSKDIQPEELVQIIRRVADGEYFVGDQVMD